jgi:hypothetical protein
LPRLWALVAVLSVIKIKDKIEEVSLLVGSNARIKVLKTWNIVSQPIFYSPTDDGLFKTGTDLDCPLETAIAEIQEILEEAKVENIFSFNDYKTCKPFLEDYMEFYMHLEGAPAILRKFTFPYEFAVKCVLGLNKCHELFPDTCVKRCHENDDTFPEFITTPESFLSPDSQMIPCACAASIEIFLAFYEIANENDFYRQNQWYTDDFIFKSGSSNSIFIL